MDTTVTISIIEDNFWGERNTLLRDAPTGEILLFESKSIPVQTTCNGAGCHQMIKVGIKELRIQEASFNMFSSPLLHVYLKNESDRDLHILRGSVTKSFKSEDNPGYIFDAPYWELKNLRIAPGEISVSPPAPISSAPTSYLGLQFKLTGTSNKGTKFYLF